MHRSQLKDKLGLKLFNGAYPQCRDNNPDNSESVAQMAVRSLKWNRESTLK